MKINSRLKNYEVTMVRNFFHHKDLLARAMPESRPFYFIDQNFYTHYRDQVDHFCRDGDTHLIGALETNKEYYTLAKYYNWLLDLGFTRRDVLVTLGGGILQDISGFIASTLYRGLRWIFIPTTLLAQADSCIGSKTSINFGDSKNMIGTFYPPDHIFVDPALTETLTPEYFNSGVGEIIKFHLLSDQDGYTRMRSYLFSQDPHDPQALEEIILSTLAVKYSYFEEDEFDTGRRNLLNYGHCFGHALESASNFGVCHGEAVLVGMSFADLLSLKRGVLSSLRYKEWQALYQGRYPDYPLNHLTAHDIITHLKKDKKRIGNDLTMVIPEDVGVFHKCDDITEQEIEDVYAVFCQNYQNYKKLKREV